MSEWLDILFESLSLKQTAVAERLMEGGRSLASIAREIGCSRERVRQIRVSLRRKIEKAQRMARARELAEEVGPRWRWQLAARLSEAVRARRARPAWGRAHLEHMEFSQRRGAQ